MLEVGSVFFLFKSIAVKEKNPNELFSYLTLTSILNVFFIYKLISDAVDCHNGTYGSKSFWTELTFWLALLGILGCVLVLVFVYLTIMPLREGIYEEIFWDLGGNQNVLENHKARTQFVAALEIDFFVIFEFCLTVGFFCYDLSTRDEQTKAEAVVDWTVFASMVMVGLGNNFHGYFVMKTIEGTFNSKCYFIVRLLLQMAILYTGVCIFQGKSMSWELLPLEPAEDKLYKRTRFYTSILMVVSMLVCGFVIYSARKLLKVKFRTLLNLVRSGGP